MGIGFQEITSSLAEEKGIDIVEGVYVGEVHDLSAAMEAGIEIGDVITAINGVKSKMEQLCKNR